MDTSKVRVRFAPSPTGLLHIGNVRTAFFNWLFAKKMKGKFIIRIDDTDILRSTRDFEENILNDLNWLGMDWDEGPDKGGNFGPYRQSERKDIYNRYAEQLINKGKAYPCFCTSDELDNMRMEQAARRVPPGYTGKCFSLTREKIESYIKLNRPYAIRFRVPERAEDIGFNDIVKGNVSFNTRTVKDFVILRSDGIASYNFAVVIDDHLMHISHVIRGDDHLPNMPKQLLIYESLGFNAPFFAHLPMIVDRHRRPLSKRTPGISVTDLKRQGFLKEAILNGVALLGWSLDEKREIFQKDELTKMFLLDKVGKGHVLFDEKKFKWINKQHIFSCSAERLKDIILPFISDSLADTEKISGSRLTAIVSVMKENIEILSDAADLINIFFGDTLTFTPEALSFLDSKEVCGAVNSLKYIIEESKRSGAPLYQEIVKELKKTGLKGRSLFMPIRVAITGRTIGPELINIFKLIEKDILIKRVNFTCNKLNAR